MKNRTLLLFLSFFSSTILFSQPNNNCPAICTIYSFTETNIENTKAKLHVNIEACSGNSSCDGDNLQIPFITQNESHAKFTISSTASVLAGDDVEFRAGDEIALDVNFSVDETSNFEAKIEDCEDAPNLNNDYETFAWQYRIAGTETWTSTTDTNVPNKYINGLNPCTNYEWQVKLECTNNVWTNWIGLNNFTTTCDVMAAPTFCIGQPIVGNVGDIVTVDIIAKDFTNLASIAFTLAWDNAKLGFVESQTVEADPSVPILVGAGMNFNTNNTTSGIMQCLWADIFGTVVTLPSPQILFSVEFEILNSMPTSLEFTNNPTPMEVVGGPSSTELGVLDASFVCGAVNPLQTGNLIISNCPNDIVLIAENGADSAIATWIEPSVSSTCDTNCDPIIDQVEGQFSGASFALGTTTTISYEAFDGCGHVEICTFTVSVN